MGTTSVVIPVKDGERWLAEVLAAVRREGPDEVLVIDSGSGDASVAIARAAGASVVEIAPAAFGHGRTRNLALEHTSSELLVYLTQDATPVPGWLAAYRDAFDADPRIEAAFGPHLPRPDTSPMIARELEQFFAGFSPDGSVAVQTALDDGTWHPGFLSNANAAYRRSTLQRLPFRDVAYAEDQAFARDLLTGGGVKAYVPGAAVLHAHDYPWGEFMRRYFDEYRGLRETVGHVEPIGARSSARIVRDQVAADRAWMADRGVGGAERTLWTARSAAHHGGRRVFSALGSRAERLPAPAQRALSLEGRAGGGGGGGEAGGPLAPQLRHVGPSARAELFQEVADLLQHGPAPLLPVAPGDADRDGLHIAVLIPPFSEGSGGHNSIFQILRGLEERGHTVSIWLDDPLGHKAHERAAVVRDQIREWFAPVDAPVYTDIDGDWFGADVVVATGWQTVHRTMRLPGARARAYLVHDHENEFYATSAEQRWAEETYRLGLFHICSSPWLLDLVTERYDGAGSLFDFGVDHDVYRPLDVERDPRTVLFYCRGITPRRAVPLGLLALAELHRRRPDVRIVMFGERTTAQTTFPFEHAGIASHEQLATLYNQATAGLVLSMTNYSLVPQEMLACGLPVVDLAGFSAETVFGGDGPVELSEFSPGALADHIEHLLDDAAVWERRSAAGRAFVDGRTWTRAAGQVEDGLREALRRRADGDD